MISFRDMAFCLDAPKCANSDGCYHYFGKQQEEAARKWWGNDDYPVAFMSRAEQCEKFVRMEVGDGGANA